MAKALVVLLLLAAASPALAQQRAGGEFRVNTYTTGGQVVDFGRSLSLTETGEFVVAWRTLAIPTRILGQLFERDGTPRGGEFQVSSYTTGDKNSARVAALSGGDGFVVAWTSVGQDGDGSGIFAQVYDAAGARRGGEFRVNEYTASHQYTAGIAAGPRGSFVVVWSSLGQDGSGYGVVGRRFDRTGAALGAEFLVNTHTTGSQQTPDVDVARDGSFVVAWSSPDQDGSSIGLRARRYDPAGLPLGGEFGVNAHTTGVQSKPSVAVAGNGTTVIAWHSVGQDGDGYGVYARRFAAGGAPIGTEFVVNQTTTSDQEFPTVDADEIGNFVVAFQSSVGGFGLGAILARRFDANGTPIMGEFRADTTDSNVIGPRSTSVALDEVGNFVIDWNLFDLLAGSDVMAQRYGGLHPAALRVDTAGNGVLEPGETGVLVRPSWANSNGSIIFIAGQLSNPTGPPGGIPGITMSQGNYGNVPTGAVVECTTCYRVTIPAASPRPVVHWDTTVDELLQPIAQGQNKRWTLHVGESFTDVPPASGFYRFIETLLHHNITGGCTPATYCPGATSTREQMAVFVLVAKEGPGYVPPACGATPMFPDVPPSSPFCRWVEELARRGVVGGCGGGNYCPASNVVRDQMAVFVLRTVEPALNPPACGATPMFADVPVP